jgi:DNA invertase Pin-like site-specific DNA recombinase
MRVPPTAVSKAAICLRRALVAGQDDGQHPQLRPCRRELAQRGWKLAKVYSDDGYGGLGSLECPALSQLLNDAAAGDFTAVVVTDLNRIARDVSVLAAIERLLAEASVVLHALDGGILESDTGRLIRSIFRDRSADAAVERR